MSTKCVQFFILASLFLGNGSFQLPPMILQGLHFSETSVSPEFDPCTDFFSYACNKWLKESKKPLSEAIWNPWISVAHKIRHRLSILLSHHSNADLVRPQIYHRACLQVANQEQKYLHELISLVQNVGGWPLANKEWDQKDYDWLKQLAQMTRLLGIHPILKIHADLDYANPRNVMVYIEPGDLIFPQHVLIGRRDYGSELEAYEKWILDSARHMFANFTGSARHLVRFEVQLAELMQTRSRGLRTTVKNLTNISGLRWMDALNEIFQGFVPLSSETVIAVKHYDYLKRLLHLFQKTRLSTIADYIVWYVIKDLARDTTQHMRNLSFLIDQAILGIKQDLSREEECIDKTAKYFSSLLVKPYVESYIPPKTFSKVASMFDQIKVAFMETLVRNKWMSKEAKLLTVEKIQKVRMHLGHPLKYTSENKVHITKNHFRNTVKLKTFQVTLKLLSASQNKTLWPASPFDVNAYYSILENSIYIPLPLLEQPFFLDDRDDNLNYGALGALIGHEISHSLDSVGILADPTGKVHKWWPESDLEEYQKRSQCFGNGENMADKVGLGMSLRALRNKKAGKEFFLSFAQMWCEVSEDNKDIFSKDEHSLNPQRVQNVFGEKEFAEAFSCTSVKSGCELW